jgi:hypothetical protein
MCVDAQNQQKQQQSKEKCDVVEERLQVLDAAEYLFISTDMAKAFPHLVESMIVLSYHSCFPGEISKKWLLGSTARISRYESLRQATLLSGVVLGLQYIATAPFLLQRILVRFTQPLFLTCLILMWYSIHNSVFFSLFFIIVVLPLGALCFKYYKDTRRGSGGEMGNKVQPVTTGASVEEDEDDDTDDGHGVIDIDCNERLEEKEGDGQEEKGKVEKEKQKRQEQKKEQEQEKEKEKEDMYTEASVPSYPDIAMDSIAMDSADDALSDFSHALDVSKEAAAMEESGAILVDSVIESDNSRSDSSYSDKSDMSSSDGDSEVGERGD